MCGGNLIFYLKKFLRIKLVVFLVFLTLKLDDLYKVSIYRKLYLFIVFWKKVGLVIR